MITYTLILKLEDTQEIYRYNMKLTPQQEDDPKSIFDPQTSQSLRTELQRQTECKINDYHLNLIIHTWIEDIQEGYRDTSITLALPSLLVDKLEKLEDSGYQVPPKLVYPTLTDVEPQQGALPPLSIIC